MEVALTFGSLGDIIAVCQMSIQLGRALGVGCGGAGGSAKEYQELRGDLDAFVQILMQVGFGPSLHGNGSNTFFCRSSLHTSSTT
jgi:hypothetical protein